MPLVATVSIMASTRAATSGSITWRTGAAANGFTTVPSAATTSRTNCGRNSMPPLAKAEAPWIICSAVTESSCPIAMVGLLRPDHSPVSRSVPGLSPGNGEPVGSPNPNMRSMWWKVSASIRSEACAVPALLE